MPGPEPTRVLDLAMEKLRFDPENPRLPRSIDTEDESAVLEYMLRDATLTDLMLSIAESGYFAGEPILVVPAGSNGDGIYVVVEGNRRFAAAKLLSYPKLAPTRKRAVDEIAKEATYRPSKLPALVYEIRHEILDYLGYRHITGVAEWDSLAKARYLHQLLGDRPKSPMKFQAKLRELAAVVGAGKRTDYVRRLLNGLALYEFAEQRQFFDLPDVDEDRIEFSLLTTAIGYAALASFVNLDPTVISPSFPLAKARLLFSWLFQPADGGETVVAESRQLRDLAAVVASPPALKRLQAGASLAEARLLTDEPVKVFRKTLETARQRLDLGLTQAAVIEHFEPADLDGAMETRNVARSIVQLVSERIDDA